MQNLISLQRGICEDLIVSPRGLARRVWISAEALKMLQQAQRHLPEGMTFIVLRGYERGSWGRKIFRSVFREIGSSIFKLIYPNRAEEAPEIFCPNGHDIDGNHIDVALADNGRRLRFLAFGVFTPARYVTLGMSNARIDIAWRALRTAGFRIHQNPTEALQIHCDVG